MATKKKAPMKFDAMDLSAPEPKKRPKGAHEDSHRASEQRRADRDKGKPGKKPFRVAPLRGT